MTVHDPYDCSAAVLRTLTKTFWSSQGWRRPPVPPGADDFARAIEAGIMFRSHDPSDHNVWVERARVAANSLTLRDVSEAFIASLTSRRLDLRSALSSYAVAKVLPRHDFAVGRTYPFCSVCGGFQDGTRDLNVLNFERFKWGGVRKLQIYYIAFDLEQFARAPRAQPGAADRALLREIIDFIGMVPPSTTAPQLAQMLKLIPGNTAERKLLVDALGIVGALESPENPGFRQHFVEFSKRAAPTNWTESEYPVQWWKSVHGINREAVSHFLNVHL